MNHGVGAEGLLAAQSALQDSADNYGNDPRLEQLWAMKAMDHAEVYFNLLCSVDPSRLKLTGSLESDTKIYEHFKETFPKLNVGKLTEADIKAEAEKIKWREFSDFYKDVEDYSLGSLLRLDSSLDYSEDNTIIAIKIQFLAIEIARNREDFNDCIRDNFKPTPRKPKAKGQQQGAGGGGNKMTEIEHELQQIIGGNHQLLR
jgi:hypothetical protein